VAADTDIFDDDLEPKYDVGIYRITISVNPGVVVYVKVTRGTKSKNINLNEGSALVPDAGYTFDIQTVKGDKINLRAAAGTTVNYLVVSEIGAMGP